MNKTPKVVFKVALVITCECKHECKHWQTACLHMQNQKIVCSNPMCA